MQWGKLLSQNYAMSYGKKIEKKNIFLQNQNRLHCVFEEHKKEFNWTASLLQGICVHRCNPAITRKKNQCLILALIFRMCCGTHKWPHICRIICKIRSIFHKCCTDNRACQQHTNDNLLTTRYWIHSTVSKPVSYVVVSLSYMCIQYTFAVCICMWCK